MGGMPSVTDTITMLGGSATWSELRAAHSKRHLLRCVEGAQIVRMSRGRYIAASTAEHLRLTEAHSAILSHCSAAIWHGWKVKSVPERPSLIVANKRHVAKGLRHTADLHYVDLLPRDVRRRVTVPERTVLDCARSLPFDEALTVADSALRAGDIEAGWLRQAAERLRGPGSRQARRVAAVADGRAANPLESVLRAIVLEIPGVDVVLQFVVAEPGAFAVVDLADPGLRLVIEAEGFEYHGSRDDWRKDCRRYTEIVAAGWTVLRFTYDDVMHRPAWVRATILRWLSGRPHQQVMAS